MRRFTRILRRSRLAGDVLRERDGEDRKLKLEAESASQAKHAFLASMSHEIRTPLNAVLGFIHLLQGTGLTALQQDYLDKAGISARHLHAVISDILDCSRIEAGRIDLENLQEDGAAGRPPGPIQGVDVAGTLARLELDSDTYLRLLQRFAAAQPAELSALRAALDQGDRAGAARLAHSLKGAALNLGASAIGAAARELEEGLAGAAAWQEPLARLQERLGELQDSLALMPAEQEAPAPAADWPAILDALARLRQSLSEDDARAGHDLMDLAALLKGSPLQAALAPMKARIENYDYGRALGLFPAFEARVEQARRTA